MLEIESRVLSALTVFSLRQHARHILSAHACKFADFTSEVNAKKGEWVTALLSWSTPPFQSSDAPPSLILLGEQESMVWKKKKTEPIKMLPGSILSPLLTQLLGERNSSVLGREEIWGGQDKRSPAPLRVEEKVVDRMQETSMLYSPSPPSFFPCH